MAATAIASVFAVGGLAPVAASGEVRTISLTHIHTGESLTVTYKRDGHYIPSAMRQINYLLRDWRKNETTSMDPRTVDLIWELHEDLGSNEPVNIVCGFRSAGTNAFLKRIGRNVAKESQHIRGNAIDFYFPDVPTVKIRNLALAREMGGVGYYRSAGGPTGFLHADSGSVRHWGPEISSSQMAQIMRDNQRLVGHRGHGKPAEVDVASNDDEKQAPPGFFSKLFGLNKAKPAPAPVQVAAAPPPPPPKPVAKDAAANAAYKDDSADMADLTEDAAKAPKPKQPAGPKLTQTQMASLGDLSQDAATPPPKTKHPVQVADEETGDAADAAPDSAVKKGRIIPKPRFKPVDVMLLAAANMKTAPQMIRIDAASAPPPDQSGKSVQAMGKGLGVMMEAAAAEPQKSASGKGNLGAELRNGTAKGLPVIRPMMATTANSDIDWWPSLALRSPEEAVRRDGKPALIGTLDQDVLPQAANLAPARLGSMAYAAGLPEEQHAADGKGDLIGSN